MSNEILIVIIVVLVIVYIASPTTFNQGLSYINNFFNNLINPINPNCAPNWNCGQYSVCSNSIQTRSCTDSNNCNQNINKPVTQISCSLCTPICSGKVCGDDGCGGTCGTCLNSNYCSNNQCVSNPTTYDVSCTTSDTNWKCGTYSSCSGLFYTRKCCYYSFGAGSFPAGFHEITQKFYCTPPTQPQGSSTGQIYIYLATDDSIDAAELSRFSQAWRSYLFSASEGILDNINFIMEPNANFASPKLNPNSIGTQIKASYYLSRNYPTAADTFNSQFNSNINWLYSVANFHGSYPSAWTTIFSGDVSSNGCWENSGTHDICHESSHELAHALFGCDDDEGDIMRPTPDLIDNNKFPPICLERIKNYMTQIVED